jgi:acetolactate synthase-1/2/3 large subunit
MPSSKIKVSDFVAQFIAEQNIKHVFSISGGASLHLIHSVAEHDSLVNICPHHEQAAAMAADAYSRISGNMGAAIATSGPGATNLITGICCAYYDSVPVLYITGQVSTFRLKDSRDIRQKGFQETEIVKMIKPVTKYAVIVKDKNRIQYELGKAVYMARSGRPGPVLIDIPDNLQREYIELDKLESFVEEKEDDQGIDAQMIKDCFSMINNANRPVLVIGWGVYLSDAAEDAVELAKALKIPLLTTWACVDLFPSDFPYLVGTFGTHGTRHGNFTIQNADLILSIGSRLDTHATGSPPSSFAREARKIINDISDGELKKHEEDGIGIDIAVNLDAGKFIRGLLDNIHLYNSSEYMEWKNYISDLKQAYPVLPAYVSNNDEIDPYIFVDTLSSLSYEEECFFIDTGCVLPWIMQAFKTKKKQRLFHAFNNTPMGYALPGSIAASLFLDKKRVICLTGDGGLQINIQELATIAHHNLPVKIIVIDNNGYAMIRQTQDQWLGSKYIASSPDGGVSMPDFVEVAKAYGLQACSIKNNSSLKEKLKKFLISKNGGLCSIKINENKRVVPQTKYGRPIEDSEPLLPRNEFRERMIVPPIKESETV